jgi:hypothetical protein
MIHNLLRAALVALFLIPALASAHGPSRQKVEQQIEINAPVAKVWGIISDFCSIKSWDPAVTACEDDKGNTPGSVRTITLENGQKLTEQLVKYNAEAFSYQYMMLKPNPEAFPINTHGSFVSLKAGDNGKTIMEWKGAFYRSFPGPTPPPGQTDEDATKALSAFYMKGLEKVKKLAEGG